MNRTQTASKNRIAKRFGLVLVSVGVLLLGTVGTIASAAPGVNCNGVFEGLTPSDPVTKTADVTEAVPGASVTYTVSWTPNGVDDIKFVDCLRVDDGANDELNALVEGGNLGYDGEDENDGSESFSIRVPDDARLIGHTIVDRVKCTKGCKESKSGLVAVSVIAPVDAGDDTSGDDDSGDDTSGDDTSGDDTSGDDTSGDDTSGDDTSGDDTSGDDTSGDDDSGDDTSGDDTSGDDTSGDDTSGDDTSGDDDSGDDTSGDDTSGDDTSGDTSGDDDSGDDDDDVTPTGDDDDEGDDTDDGDLDNDDDETIVLDDRFTRGSSEDSVVRGETLARTGGFEAIAGSAGLLFVTMGGHILYLTRRPRQTGPPHLRKN